MLTLVNPKQPLLCLFLILQALDPVRVNRLEVVLYSLATVHMEDEKLLIGSSVNKELDTLWRYVKHFRNLQSSPL